MRIPVFVINLARSPRRMEAMRYQLNALGLSFERHDATDARQLSAGEIESVVAHDRGRSTIGRRMTDGEIATCLSHAAVLELVANRTAPLTLVLEDDVVLEPAISEVCQRLVQSHPEDGVWVLGASAPEGSSKLRRRRFSRDLWLRRPTRNVWGAGAYIVTPMAAQRLLAELFPLDRPIDSHWSSLHMPPLNIWVLTPPVAWYRPAVPGQSLLERDRAIARTENSPRMRLVQKALAQSPRLRSAAGQAVALGRVLDTLRIEGVVLGRALRRRWRKR